MFKHVTPSGQTVCVVSWGGDVQVRVILPNGLLERVDMKAIGLSKSNRLHLLPSIWSNDPPTKKEAQKEIKGRYKRPVNFEVFEHKYGELREFRSFKKAVMYASSKPISSNITIRTDFGCTNIITRCSGYIVTVDNVIGVSNNTVRRYSKLLQKEIKRGVVDV